MPVPTQPAFLKRPVASGGDRQTIPDVKQVSGGASLTDGFPVETQLPLNEGGICPRRLDFNGLYHMLSAFAFFAQGGGLFTWNSQTNYVTPGLAYHGGAVWFCLKNNGPDAGGTVTPGTNPAVWQDLFMWLVEHVPDTGGGGGGGSGLPDSVTSMFGGNPVGTIIMYYGNSAPAGYLACNGSSFSSSSYPKLYALLGKATTPDMRGLFLRCTGGAAGGLGQVQQDAGRNLTGEYPYGQDANSAMKRSGTGALDAGPKWADSNNLSETIASWAPDWYTLTLDASRVWGGAHTGSEFRPVNMSVLFCIRHD
jgi:microcystin-dependent protein